MKKLEDNQHIVIEKSKNVIPMKKCIVAFLDILGSSAILCSDDRSRVSKYINGIEGLYDMILDRFYNFHIKTFSDNLLIFSEDSSDSGIAAMVASVAQLQYEILKEFGLMLRGGIVVDDLHWNEKSDDRNNDFVIGKSIVRAYEMESRTAIYSRVLIAEKDFSDYFNRYNIDDISYVIKDGDGNLYIDYLQVTLNDGFTDDDMMYEHISALKRHVYEDLDNIICKDYEWDKIRSKDIWALCYHNSFCIRHDIPVKVGFTEEFDDAKRRIIIKFDDDV